MTDVAKNIKKSLLFLTIAAGAAGILIILYKFNPEHGVFFPKCPFHLLTGLDCPGCGSQRALHSLLHGKIGEALHYNALMVMSIPYLMLWVSLRLLRMFRNFREKAIFIENRLYGSTAAWIWLGIILLFWLLRNLTPTF